MADESGARAGLSFGFGLAGLLAAVTTYYAFDFGWFDGPKWRNALVAIAIGGGSAFLMLGLDRLVRSRRAAGPRRRRKPRGSWYCPECGAAYVPEAEQCSDCHVPLVGER